MLPIGAGTVQRQAVILEVMLELYFSATAWYLVLEIVQARTISQNNTSGALSDNVPVPFM